MPSKPFYKKYEFWIAIAGLILSVVTTWIAVSEHRDKVEEKQKREIAEAGAMTAESNEKEAKQRLQELQEKMGKEKDSIHTFMNSYKNYLERMHNAASRFNETKNPADADELLAATTAFVNFVKAWRIVQPLLKDLLDGEVDKLDVAIQMKNLQDIEMAEKVLGQNYDGKQPLLERAIDNIK